MLPIHMDSDHRFAPKQMFFRKFSGDLRGLFRCDFSWLEGLDDVAVHHSFLLAVGPLGFQHLAALSARATIQVGGEDMLQYSSICGRFAAISVSSVANMVL